MSKSLIKSGIAGINIVSAYMIIVAAELRIAVTCQACREIFVEASVEEGLLLLLRANATTATIAF